jgi:hypothetical protein
MVFRACLVFFLSTQIYGVAAAQDLSLKALPSNLISLSTQNPLSFLPAKVNQQTSCMVIPSWSADKLPFFCRIEHRMAKKLSVPVLFRLGSVEYVNWLEGKGGTELMPFR